MRKAAAKKNSDKEIAANTAIKTLVSIHFGGDVRKSIKRGAIEPETAICLCLVGAKESASQFEIEFGLRGALDRDEAAYLASMGCASLIGRKLAKYSCKPSQLPEDRRTVPLELTAAGNKVWSLVYANLANRPLDDVRAEMAADKSQKTS